MDRVDIYEDLAAPSENNQYTKLFTKEQVDLLRKAIEQQLKDDSERFNSPMVTTGHLHFMIGLPRSGKSTWATKWMRAPSRQVGGVPFPRVVVCADNIRLAVHGQRFNSRAEPTVHMIKDYMTVSLLDRGHDVLVDGTHTTKASLRRLMQIDPNATWTHIATPKDVCQERAVACGQADLVPIIERMGRQLQTLLDSGISSVLQEIKEELKKLNHRAI